MIGIGTYLYDIEGARTFRTAWSETQVQDVTRRLSKSQTLDQGVFINDLGYTDGDRTMQVSVEDIDGTVYAFWLRLIQTYPRVVITTQDGAFDGWVQQVQPQPNRGTVRVTLEIKDRVS